MAQKPISELRNFDKNPRSISKDSFERLKKHIQKYGQQQPLVITPDGEVLGGNMRLRAYKELDITDIWVHEYTPRDEADKLAISLVLNDRAGFYDSDLLANLIPDYKDFPWEDYSIDIKEPTNLKELIDRFTPIAEDEAPEISKEPTISKLGEIYQLGRHRLMCGDATKIEDVEKLMGGQKMDCIYTDPPYGINLEAGFEWSKGNESMGIKPSKGYEKIEGDNKSFDYQQFAWINAREEFWWGADYYIRTLPEGGSWIVWDKKNDDLKEVWTNEFELLWSKNKHKKYVIRILWNGALGTESEDIKNRVHPTQKPIRVVADTLNRLDKEVFNILDLFGGSGSTLITCEQTGRTCYMMELDTKYCDVIRKRYHKLKTGSEEGWIEGTPKIE